MTKGLRATALTTYIKSKSKSKFIRNATRTRTNISKIINCKCVALHGCHLAKSRLPVTPSSLKITIITVDIQYTFVVLQHNTTGELLK